MRKGIDIIKQLKEKLGKSADAGDYIDDFKKSDAPQFKGKSDKKKEKMAVAAYLDSKEEVKEEKRQLKDPKKEAMVMKVKDSGSIMVIDKKDLEKYLSKGYIQVEDNIQEALKHSYVLIDTSRNNKVVGSGSDKKSLHLRFADRKGRILLTETEWAGPIQQVRRNDQPRLAFFGSTGSGGKGKAIHTESLGESPPYLPFPKNITCNVLRTTVASKAREKCRM